MTDQRPEQYRIGEAAALSGVGVESIRAWERRYAAITPSRDDGNLRIYSPQDVERLTLMRELTHSGARIGDIAHLTETELRSRLTRIEDSGNASSSSFDHPCNVVLIGPDIANLSDSDRDQLTITGRITSLEAWSGDVFPDDPVVILQADIPEAPEALKTLAGLRARGASNVLWMYRFMPADTLAKIRSDGAMTMRLTHDPGEIEHALLARHYWDIAGRNQSEEHLTQPVPPRRLRAHEIARARQLSSKLACECPRHLADLITQLNGFEDYSRTCESASPADAQVHAMLRSAAGHARHIIEGSLVRLAEADGFEAELFDDAM